MKARRYLTILISLFLLGCSNKQINFDTGTGFACFDEPQWPNDKKQHYLCVFELNTVSPHSSNSDRMVLVNKFVKKIGKECTVSEAQEMVDPKAEADHGMYLMVHHVRCN
ncbi:hypothetical protein [Rheinheimera sp. KL1]|uniref:hypothetical protein n=1 Tax=Rheinheimera sp. KL1 TaxID=1635005 RepID=UPI0012667232|nr:hypothetical protein [Rheinheimera sp. KL1]